MILLLQRIKPVREHIVAAVVGSLCSVSLINRVFPSGAQRSRMSKSLSKSDDREDNHAASQLEEKHKLLGREVDVGRLGLVMVLAGMVGSVCCGVILDKTHKYKEVTLAIYFMSLVGLVIYTFTLNCGYIEVVYFTIIFLGFFMTGYLPVGFELAAELTYPEPEGTSAGMLNASVQVFGIAFTLFYAWLFELAGDMWANGALCITLVAGTVITAVIRADLRRQSAQRQHLQPLPLPA